MDERQTQSAELHPRDRIQKALVFFDSGGPQIRTGGGDSGPPLYDSAEQGWRLGMESDWSARAGSPGEAPLVYRFYVEHVGTGRREALPMYLQAMRTAGLEASLGPIHEGSSKQVVWLDGKYDGEGRRVG
jgi:hypothetical protein